MVAATGASRRTKIEEKIDMTKYIKLFHVSPYVTEALKRNMADVAM